MYLSAGEIFLSELATGITVKVASGVPNGWSFEISPDASKLAWIEGATVMGCMRNDLAARHIIATGILNGGGVHWIDNANLAYVKNGAWKRKGIDGSPEQDLPALTALGAGGFETDVKLGTDGVWSYVDGSGQAGPIWKTSDGKSGPLPGHCSSSLSPDGKSATSLNTSHLSCNLTPVRPGGVSDSTFWVYEFTAPKGFDNQRWSSNDARFVVSQDEKYNFVVVHNASGTEVTRMGNKGTGEMYGDFSAGSGASGAPWHAPGGSPALDLSPGTLDFSAAAGGADPAAKAVMAKGQNGLSLADLQVFESAAWLSVTVSGTGDARTMTNTVAIAGLTGTIYSAQVTVSAGGKSAAYQANLSLSHAPAEPGLTLLSPNGGEQFPVGDTLLVQWKGRADWIAQDRITGVNIYFSADNGKTWHSILPDGSVFTEDPDWGRYPWVIPAQVGGAPAANAEARIRIEEYNDDTMEDRSDAVFTIRESTGLGARPGRKGGRSWRLYSLDGRPVKSPGPPGVYLLKTSEGVRKLIFVP